MCKLLCVRETLAKKQEDLRGHETEIVNATKGMDFETSLETAQSSLQKSQKYEACCELFVS
jgi:hypothetical protein